MTLPRIDPSRSQTITLADIQKVTSQIFGFVSSQDVRQCVGKAYLNAGEITTQGVSQLLDNLAVSAADSLADIGCGVGNVLV